MDTQEDIKRKERNKRYYEKKNSQDDAPNTDLIYYKFNPAAKVLAEKVYTDYKDDKDFLHSLIESM